MTDPKRFTIERQHDRTGVSGTGRVLDGVVFHTGQVVVCWRSDLRVDPGHSSLGIYPSWDAFAQVHLQAHPENEARIIWLDDGNGYDDAENVSL